MSSLPNRSLRKRQNQVNMFFKVRIFSFELEHSFIFYCSSFTISYTSILN